MKIPDSNQSKFFTPVFLIEDDRLPRILEHVNGITTGLNAIGFAVIEAGFAGVHGLAVTGRNILWHVQFDTPEGVFFACLCDAATRGHPLPSAEQVLAVIRPLFVATEGLK